MNKLIKMKDPLAILYPSYYILYVNFLRHQNRIVEIEYTQVVQSRIIVCKHALVHHHIVSCYWYIYQVANQIQFCCCSAAL